MENCDEKQYNFVVEAFYPIFVAINFSAAFMIFRVVMNLMIIVKQAQEFFVRFSFRFSSLGFCKFRPLKTNWFCTLKPFETRGAWLPREIYTNAF